jgi:hypothetical protein
VYFHLPLLSDIASTEQDSLEQWYSTWGTQRHLGGYVKQPGRESYQSPPSSAEVKNSGAILPFPHTSSWHRA